MNLTINGEVKHFEDGMNALDIAGKLPGDVKKTALAAKLDGQVISLVQPIQGDHVLELLTFDDEDGRKTLRHTASHVLAQAVLHLNPKAKLAIGPAIENGFYYDFDVEEPFTPEFLAQVEKEMARIIKRNERLERFELPRAEALAFCEKAGQPYKVELIQDLPQDAVISFYRQGDFTDLCAGPHLPSTGKVKAFKLTSIAGAYWRGDEHNKMLQRIYGTAFFDKESLDAYLQRLEEAKKRDHRRLGRELDLFAIFDEGPGFPFFFPKGMVLRNLLEDYWRQIHREHGYEEIKTPIILSRALWERSGHWDYKNNMYTTHRRSGFRHQAHELPRRHSGLQAQALELPGPALPQRRAGPGTPPRAVRRPPRAHAGALLHPGRRPQLHDPRADQGRDQGRVQPDRPGIQRIWL